MYLDWCKVNNSKLAVKYEAVVNPMFRDQGWIS